MGPHHQFAGFWRRALAYLIDAIPITVLMVVTLGPVIGLPQAFEQYIRNRRDPAARQAFIAKRNDVRNASALALVVYGAAMEGSALGATVGKLVVGVRVIGADGTRLGFAGAFLRNVSKLLSAAIAFVGCIWAAFDKRKRGWHDLFAGSLVVKTR